MYTEKIIKSEIYKIKNDIRLDFFLKKIIYGKNGYYYSKKPIGRKNDFITAPEISQIFGEIIGLYLFYFWKTKINNKFNLIELGPGNGTLFLDIINSMSKYPAFLSDAKIKLIEINKELKKIQKKNLNKNLLLNIKWSKKINFGSSFPTVIYSNEFFDCFPIRQFLFKDAWYEKYVSLNREENRLFFNNRIVTKNKLLNILEKYKDNRVYEISAERNKYFNKLCKFINKNGGIILTVDYGYLNKINNFTLQGIQNHKFSSVLENLGEKDISSHVNFTDLVNIAKKNKLKIEEFCTQREFLIKYGILERKKTLSKLNNQKSLNQEIERLIGKKNMGNLFKVLVVSNL